MMGGPNIAATKALAEAVSIPIIASGGVSSLHDIEQLMAVESSGISGVITGKAIYTGALSLPDAIALTKQGLSC